MSDMGTRITIKRKENNLTMQELADKLGVQASAVNKWEKGIVENIKRPTIQAMANIFNCSPTWLMGFDDATEHDTIKSMASEDAMILKKYHQLSSANKEVLKSTLDALLDAQTMQ